MSNRKMSWAAALRDLKSNRQRRHDVREERLKTTAGLRGTPAIPLSAWRGRSGCRYVVGVYGVSADLDVFGPLVVLAVVRDAAGIADRIAVASIADHVDLACFIATARSLGANELHVHHLCADAAEALAMVEDLKPDADLDLTAAARDRGQSLAADLYEAR